MKRRTPLFVFAVFALAATASEAQTFAVGAGGSLVNDTGTAATVGSFRTGGGFLFGELELETDHASGQLRNGDGPYVFVAEVPENQEAHVQIVLKVPSAETFCPDPAIEVVTPFEDTHYGTKEMTVRDPDGRTWTLQAPGGH